MKSCLILFLTLAIILNTSAQTIRELSIFPCADCSYEKHIYVLGDTAVYWYNWYYEQYDPIKNTGLCSNENNVIINELEAFEDENFDTQLYVISDTSVFYYGWYMQQWYPLSTTGLNRVNGKPALRSLQAFVDRDGDTRVYLISNDSIMYYEWYYAQWYPLNNPVLGIEEVAKINNTQIDIKCFVSNDILYLEIEFQKDVSEKYNIDIYDMKGRKYNRTLESNSTKGKVWKQISIRNLSPGAYILVLKSDSYYERIKFIKP